MTIQTKAIRTPAIRDKENDQIVRNILNWSKKIKSIQHKGEICNICGENNPIVLVFHHYDGEKEFTINGLKSRRARWGEIEKELDKCILLCENCHRELHYGQSTNNGKLLCLEHTSTQCVKCGYKKCQAALEFHHRDVNDKEFGISKRLNGKMCKLTAELLTELEKCDVLCANCHKLEHDKGFYEKYKEEILSKAANLSEKAQVNPELIIQLKNQGYTAKQIANKTNFSYSRVYEILRANKLQDTRSINYGLIVQLYNDGQSTKEIAKQANCSKAGVRYHLKKCGLWKNKNE